MKEQDILFNCLDYTSLQINEETYKTLSGATKFTPGMKLEAMFWEMMKSICDELSKNHPFNSYEDGKPFNYNRNDIFRNQDFNELLGSIKQYLEFYDDAVDSAEKRSYFQLYKKVFSTPIIVDGKRYYFNFKLEYLYNKIGKEVENIIYNKRNLYPITRYALIQLEKVIKSAYKEIIKEIISAYNILENKKFFKNSDFANKNSITKGV